MQIFRQTTGSAGASPSTACGGMWTKAPSPPRSNFNWQEQHRSFDMRGLDRRSYVDDSGSNSLNTDGTTPSRHDSSSGVTGSSSIAPMSTESTPSITSPESVRQFDPDKIFGDINFGTNGIDVTMNMGQGMGDDGGVEFFTEILGVNLNGSLNGS
jgi:hypothetical protein